MRVDVTPLRVALSPGIAQTVTVLIANTETIIAGYAIRVLGADPGWVQLEAETLALFPDESRMLSIDIQPPPGLPAGSRRLAVQVRETTPPYASLVTEIDLSVPALPVVQMRVDPIAITAGKRATFSVLVENTGNTEIKGFLSGDDPESTVRFTFEPDAISLAPGQHSVIDMRASSKRPFFGTPTVRSLSLYLDPMRADAFFTAEQPPAAAAEEREALAGATFIQKSVMARGALSLLGLLFAATVFAIVITLALSRLVAQSTQDRNLALQVAAARNSSAATGTSGVAGTATLLTSGKPAAGVAVSIFAAADTTVAVATTATSATGAYSVTDLPAGQYKLSFRGAGFVQTWYPGAADPSNATTVTLGAAQVRNGLNVTLGGVPAQISGSVTGDDVSAATLYLETVPTSTGTAPAGSRASPLAAAPTPSTAPPDNGAAVVQQVPIGSDGTFSLTNVPSPSVYDLVVVKTGYATSTQRIDIGAGENRKAITIELAKGDGLVAGTVTSSTGALSGATITATSGQSTANTVSLASGGFTLRGLPTPAALTLVVTRAGYASETLSVSLSAGQKLTGLSVTLSRSSASLKGIVNLLSTTNGTAGGVGVTVTNGLLTIQTVTASTGTVGSWQVSGLAIPGTYTVTFTRVDLQSQTVSVSLDAAGDITPGSYGARVSSAGVEVSMQSATAVVAGVITQPGGGNVCDGSDHLGEAVVSLSSGSSSYTVTSASISPNCGRYRFEQIPPGTYTLSVSASSGTTPSSRVFTVQAGQTFAGDVTLQRPASLQGSVKGVNGTARVGWSVFLYIEVGGYPTTITQQVVTNSAGVFQFDDISAGRYIVAVGPTSDPSSATNTKRATVQPSQSLKHVDFVVTQ